MNGLCPRKKRNFVNVLSIFHVFMHSSIDAFIIHMLNSVNKSFLISTIDRGQAEAKAKDQRDMVPVLMFIQASLKEK